MADTFPPEQSPTDEGAAVDVSARLAHLTRPSGLPIFGRREVAASEPTTAPIARVIGRVTRVRAGDLWAADNDMATWIAANPAVVAETIGVTAGELTTTDANLVIGADGQGEPTCMVCETGPSSDAALGVLLRVAAVQDGGSVVWLVGEASDAHTAAVSWLNRSTAPRFFLITVTGIRIDESAAAPIFELAVRPPRAGDVAEQPVQPAAPQSAPPAELAASDAPDPGASALADDVAQGPRRRIDDHVPEV